MLCINPARVLSNEDSAIERVTRLPPRIPRRLYITYVFFFYSAGFPTHGSYHPTREILTWLLHMTIYNYHNKVETNGRSKERKIPGARLAKL